MRAAQTISAVVTPQYNQAIIGALIKRQTMHKPKTETIANKSLFSKENLGCFPLKIYIDDFGEYAHLKHSIKAKKPQTKEWKTLDTWTWAGEVIEIPTTPMPLWNQQPMKKKRLPIAWRISNVTNNKIVQELEKLCNYITDFCGPGITIRFCPHENYVAIAEKDIPFVKQLFFAIDIAKQNQQLKTEIAELRANSAKEQQKNVDTTHEQTTTPSSFF